MNRFVFGLLALVTAACSSTGPAPSNTWLLFQVDGRHLPAPAGSSDYTVLAGRLAFDAEGRPRAEAGTVAYTLVTQRLGGGRDSSVSVLDYRITQGTITIDLCPRGALCLVATYLEGRAETGGILALTHYLAGRPVATYQFMLPLPD